MDVKENLIHTTPPTKTGLKRPKTIIGGLFGLECALFPQELNPPFLKGQDVFLVNARSGIWLLINLIRPRQVWVPSYLCHTILEAIDSNTSVLRFYNVDSDLKISLNQWASEITSGDLFIFIDYFGFPYDRQIGAYVKEKGAWVLEDASQALLSSHVGDASDFVLFSPRKWTGVVDGGILRFPENFPLTDASLEPPATAWWLKAFSARILRREFDICGGGRRWYELFQEAELMLLLDLMP